MSSDSEEEPPGGVNNCGEAGVTELEQLEVEVVVQTGEEEAAQEQAQAQVQKELPEGFVMHSVCGVGFDGRIYEEVAGGKKGQNASPVWCVAVRRMSDKRILCLLCGEHSGSTFPHNFLAHLRKHNAFKQYDGQSGGGGKAGGSGSIIGSGGGTMVWSDARRAEVVRLIACMLVVNGRYVHIYIIYI